MQQQAHAVRFQVSNGKAGPDTFTYLIANSL